MNDGTSVLFGLEDEFRVLQAVRVDEDQVQVIIEVSDPAGGCPTCGVVGTRVKERPLVRIQDLPVCGQRTGCGGDSGAWCAPNACETKTFTQASTAVQRRARTTQRLKEQVARAIAVGNRAVSEVAAEYGISWHTGARGAHRRRGSVAARTGTDVLLGIDGTRARSVRWVLEEEGWKRSDP